MENNELKPCPFCGGEAYTYTAINIEKGIRRRYWLVHCKKCGLNYPTGSHKCFEELKAIECWNRRADDGTNRDN
jgi:Lar family restriction alleviation protein